ncbi:MAG: PilC/PilY family type IV pilus protein [Rhodoferax sp.]|nr:PilC/PilY family type IV pilus protein [Rhodoferax sp.]
MTIRKIFPWLSCCIVATMMAGSGAQTGPMPSVDLSVGPLTVTSQAVNIALALSVEFPTAGAAYRGTSYDHNQEYLGYWDPKGCYEYFDVNDNSPLKGQYFRRTGSVDGNRYCNTSGNGSYSGNLLNYAATSSIDLLRYALTGGNRVLDTADKTVLGRAFLPSDFGGIRNATYFPQKQVAATLVGKVTPKFSNPGGSGYYNGTVYFNSCDDLIYVGNSATAGTCSTPGSANIFAPQVPDLSGTFTTQGFITPPVNTATTTYVLDPQGRKYWDRSQPEATTNVMPMGNDPVAGTLIPEPVNPSPRNFSVMTGTGKTPQYPGDPVVNMIYILTSGTATIAPTAGPVTVAGTTWVANSGSAGTANFEGLFVELNASNWGPNGAAGTVASNSKKITTCRRSSDNVDVKIMINGTGTCPAGTKQQSNVTAKTYLLYSQKILYQVYDAQPVYNYYQQVPAWYQASVYTVYEVYTNGTKPASMKAYVQVCDAAEGPSRQGSDGVRFCKRYPNESAGSGIYKPIGELQNKAEGVRVSAFGYALENGNGRYGGVLRAPIKFLGNQYRDTNGILQSNAQAEWDAATGVFVTDPLNATGGSPAFTTSGVVNYLNKFGNTGVYKSNDPVGELYYEALRYFQGLQPTPAAVANLTTPMYDKFPIYKNWTDPIQNGCQRRNFILSIGDVNTHYDKQLPGHSSNGVNEISIDPARATETIPGSTKKFDAVEWTKLLAGFETGTNVSYTDALGRAQNTTGNPSAISTNNNLGTKATGSASSAYYWAGAAYWANTQPIRYDSITVDGKTQSLSAIRVKTFTIDVDEGGDGSIDNNPRSIKPRNSSFFLAGKYGWFNDANEDGNPFRTSGGLVNNQEWEDPALPTVPDGYTLASQAQRMIAGIRKFFASASAQSGAVSVSSISSQRFTTSSPNGDLYAPRFDSRDWSGTVIKSTLKLNTTTQTIDAQQNVVWDSGQILTEGSTLAASATSADPYLKPAERKIFTYRREGSNRSVELSAANLAQFDSVMRDALNTNPVNVAADGLGAQRVNYLRGDRSQEGVVTNPFRRRSSVMGDIINSGPVYKKEADYGITDDGGYATFAQSAANRSAAIYVGANDGMLHALRASDGKELFAYVPLAVAGNLNKLTHSAYQHIPFVDGVPQVGEAKIGANWRTVLVSGMGGGAQGVFALDVTDPNAFEDGSGGGKVLFEFTDQDDPMMGHVVMQPRIVKMKIPAATAGGLPSYKWFVAVGSGYNNYVNDGSGRYSPSGDQALFLLSLDKAVSDSWVEGANYFKVTVPVSDRNMANGLANPGVMQGDRGEAVTMYAGDLQGNVWKFDFSAGLSSQNISDGNIFNNSTGIKKPLFTATNSAGARQPITISPLITTAQQRGVMVIFGTGKFIEQVDATSTGSQSIYGVWDSGDSGSASYGLTKSNLQLQTASEGTSTVGITTAAFNLGTGTGQKRGWYFNLPNSRERIAVEGAQGLTTVTLNSTIPTGDCSGDGDGRSYTLNALTGGSSGDIQLSSTIGLLSRPNYVSLELLDSGNYTARRADGTRKYTVQDGVISTGTKITSAGNVGSQTTKPNVMQITTGRISWREVRNFKD